MECVICGGDTGYCSGCSAKTPVEQNQVRISELVGDAIAAHPVVRAVAAEHTARSVFNLTACLAEMVKALVAENERLRQPDSGLF